MEMFADFWAHGVHDVANQGDGGGDGDGLVDGEVIGSYSCEVPRLSSPFSPRRHVVWQNS